MSCAALMGLVGSPSVWAMSLVVPAGMKPISGLFSRAISPLSVSQNVPSPPLQTTVSYLPPNSRANRVASPEPVVFITVILYPCRLKMFVTSSKSSLYLFLPERGLTIISICFSILSPAFIGDKRNYITFCLIVQAWRRQHFSHKKHLLPKIISPCIRKF